MDKKYFAFCGSDGTMLPAVIWRPDSTRAVLQIVHGMTEHMDRYENFAAEMVSHGIAVAGFDLRGHGKNPGNKDVASFGIGGWQASVEDIHQFHEHLQQLFPGIPQFILGFSLGSFLLREYLTAHSDEESLSGAIIAGTGHQPRWLLSIIMAIVKGELKKSGFDRTTDLVRQLSFGAYNQKFKPNRTIADWLCANSLELDDYLADSLVRKDISAGLFLELLGSMKRTGSVFEYDGWDTALPILLISGQDDPVGNAGKGITALYQRMRTSGLEEVTMQLLSNVRHDLLHEDSRASDFLVRWLESHIHNTHGENL